MLLTHYLRSWADFNMGMTLYTSLPTYKSLLNNQEAAERYSKEYRYSNKHISKAASKMSFSCPDTIGKCLLTKTSNQKNCYRSHTFNDRMDLTKHNTSDSVEPLDLSMECKGMIPSTVKVDFRTQHEELPLDLTVGSMKVKQTHKDVDSKKASDAERFLLNLGLRLVPSPESSDKYHQMKTSGM